MLWPEVTTEEYARMSPSDKETIRVEAAAKNQALEEAAAEEITRQLWPSGSGAGPSGTSGPSAPVASPKPRRSPRKRHFTPSPRQALRPEHEPTLPRHIGEGRHEQEELQALKGVAHLM